MAEIKWIKVTTDIFDDEKIRVIEKMPEGDTMLVIWLKLLVLAGKKNDSGLVYLTENIPYTPDILSDIFNRESRMISLALNTFASFGMIEIENDIISVLNWNKHQNIEGMEKIREQNKIRQANYRDRKKLENSNVISRDSNGTDKNKNKIRIDKDKNNKEEYNPSDDFGLFWEAYNKKENKKKCIDKYKLLYKKKQLPEIKKHIEIIKSWHKTDKWKGGFQPNPLTWLNGERWEDELPIEKPVQQEKEEVYKPRTAEEKYREMERMYGRDKI